MRIGFYILFKYVIIVKTPLEKLKCKKKQVIRIRSVITIIS